MSNDRQPRILLVEDDLRLRALLRDFMTGEGLDVTAVGHWRHAEEVLRTLPPDLIVLDLMLPGTGGLEACRDVRARGLDVPIIMLTAKGSDVDRILGLEMGADDYLGKPCNPRELVARIRAVLRRHRAAPPGAPAASGTPLRFGRFVLDPTTRALTRDGLRVSITTGEFGVLLALVSRPRETLTRDQLLGIARGRRSTAFDRAIDVQIARLRRIVEVDPARPHHIQTVRGTGYVFVPDDPPQEPA